MPTTSVGKKRLVGAVIFLAILILFVSLNRIPKLDIVGEDLDAVASPVAQCFQGFCIDREPGTSFASKWLSFSLTYMRLVTVGMVFAFLAAGMAEAFFFPPGTRTGLQGGGIFSRTVKGAALGPVMNLCSACIVPVSSAFRQRGAGIEGSIAMVQGSATMNVPALAMAFFVFTPLLGFSRLLLAVVGALIIGPLVVMTVRSRRDEPDGDPVDAIPQAVPDLSPWKYVLIEAFRDWAKASIGYVVRLGPIMVVAGFASGLVIQWLSPTTVAQYLGNDLLGITIAATFGILINVPLLFEIPLVALLLLLGMGTAPAATLLFTAAAGGPITFWGLARLMPRRAIAAFAGATWGLGAFGGLAVLGIGVFIWPDGGADLRLQQAQARASDGASTAPIVVSLDPDTRGSIGVYSVTVLGDNFQDGAAVTFGGQRAARVSFEGPQLLIVTSPKLAPGVVDVTVTNPDGKSYTLERSYTYLAGSAPIVVGVEPASGRLSGGTEVTILGANFGTGAAVFFGGTPATGVVVANAGEITAVTPAHGAADVNVTVTNSDGRSGSRADGFAYQAPAFVDVTTRAGLAFTHSRRPDIMPFGGGVVVMDADGDGWSDIYVANSDGPNALYRNLGDGAFADIAAVSGLADAAGQGNGGCAADYDNDGDTDLFATNWGSSTLFENDGSGRFADVTVRAGVGDPDPSYRSMGCAWGDYDLDGYLDLIVVRHMDDSDIRAFQTRTFEPTVRPLSLRRNRGDGTFEDVTTLLGPLRPPTNIREDGISGVYGGGFQPVWVDIDNDADSDLYVCNDFGDEVQPNRLWINNRDGGFTDVTESSGSGFEMSCMGVAIGDYDTDGFLDLYLTNIGDNVLLRNLGATEPHTFADTAALAGTTIGVAGGNWVFEEKLLRQFRVTWGNVFFDFDNDGDEDLYVVSGHLDSDPETNALEQANVLLRNDGDGVFTDISSGSGSDDLGVGRGLAALDFNGDGCLDLVLQNFEADLTLLENRCATGNNWLSVEAVGTMGNRDAIGARITIVVDGQTQIREIVAGSSQMGQHALPAHFGLGQADSVDSLTIRWLSGRVLSLSDVAPNQAVRLVEPDR